MGNREGPAEGPGRRLWDVALARPRGRRGGWRDMVRLMHQGDGGGRGGTPGCDRGSQQEAGAEARGPWGMEGGQSKIQVCVRGEATVTC